ncbi:MAG TPA: gluconokinase [Thermoanaerobaculia bacterium]|nr:gluconokinase [Thermoanaerobaculia bacterium]
MIVVLMGVAGAGKTLIGKALAERLGWHFYDADDFHSPENIVRMAAGLPLADPDRHDWYDRLIALLARVDTEGKNAILACSALRSDFRSRLRSSASDVRFVFLNCDISLCEERARNRENHYFKAGLVQTQFDALEEPHDAMEIDASQNPEAIVESILEGLGIRG